MKIFTAQNARFTVIENGVIRMEYAEDGVFCDAPTLFALRDYAVPTEQYQNIEITADERRDGDALTVETPLLRLTYKPNGKPFSRNNLTARLKIGGKEVYWYPAMKNKANLGGAMTTLDGCDGEREMPEGLIARDGWHMIDDSGASILIDGWIASRSDAHKCDYYLFVYGDDFKGALKSFARLSGKALLPRKCVFGSWYSRWHPYTAEDFREIARGYDENDFPLDIFVIDMDWHHHDWQTPEDDPHRATYGFGHGGGNLGWTGYSWNKKLIPDPPALLRDLREQGLIVTLNDHPADGVRDNEDCYPEFARRMGLDAENKENIPFAPGDKKYMEAFYACAHAPSEKAGVDFWWVDWQQDYVMPTVPGLKNQPVLPWLNHMYYEHSRADGKRGASYSRWGGWGDQKHPMYFSGDTATTWSALEFEIAMTVASANSMCFWWGHDIGGFAPVSEDRQPEMYVRWVQFGVASAAMKLHSCNERMDRRPWVWEDWCRDAIREMYHLRSRLLPAMYSVAYESYKNDTPFIRPLYYDHPELEESYRHRCEYYIGDGMFFAPVYTPGEGESRTVTKDVWLPEGVWYNFFTGERCEGAVTETCDLHSFPMYVRAGMPLPMQPYRRRMTSAPLTELIVRVYVPDGDSDETFTLYEDDGISESYMNGAFRTTAIRCVRAGDQLTVTLTPCGSYDRMVIERDVTLELWQGGKLTELSSHGSADEITAFEYTVD